MYDPTDEKVEELFSTLLHILTEVPSKVGKQALAKALEDAALLELVLRSYAGEELEEKLEAALTEHWDEVQEFRNERAASLLYSIQTNEF